MRYALAHFAWCSIATPKSRSRCLGIEVAHQSGATVLDLGCGSGVLGLAALRAGAERLVALDINPQAVLTTKTNIERLGYADQAEVRLSDVYSALQPQERFDLILFAAPYWNRKANDDLERSCFDEDHSTMASALGELITGSLPMA